MEITVPKNSRGRQSAESAAAYQQQLDDFCRGIIEINSRLDFKVSSRGWCYLLEEYGLRKGDFDQAQRVINDCRKDGRLPLDICAEDTTRTAENIDDPDDDIDAEASWLVEYVMNKAANHYNPHEFFSYQDYYLELMVEKIDLKSLFKPVCEKYHVPYANGKGWSDINSRARMMERFKQWEERGNQCVLLYCGDHDPGGQNIEQELRSNLDDLKDAVGWSPQNLIIDAFGLKYDFIMQNNLSWIDNLETGSKKRLDDPGHPDHYKPYVQNYLAKYGAKKVEANALVTRAEAGRKLYEDAILKYIDWDGFSKYTHDTNKSRQLLRDEIKTRITRI